MKVNQLSKQFNHRIVFENINLNFERGKIYSIFGKNGAGKTTLLNILNGNLAHDTGTVEHDMTSILLQSNEIPFEFMTADEFIDTTFNFKNVKYDKQAQKQLYTALQFHPGNQKIKEFSKGMKSKLYLIIALLSTPTTLLLDEPFTDIDLVSFQAIVNILQIKKQEMCIIFSTHSAKIAYELSDAIIYLDQQQAITFDNDFNSAEQLEAEIINKIEL